MKANKKRKIKKSSIVDNGSKITIIVDKSNSLAAWTHAQWVADNSGKAGFGNIPKKVHVSKKTYNRKHKHKQY